MTMLDRLLIILASAWEESNMPRLIALAISIALGVGGFTVVVANAPGPIAGQESVQQFLAIVQLAITKLWEDIEKNPIPVITGLGVFVLTIVYHKMKGMTFKEAVEAAATKVQVINVQPEPKPEDTSAAAKARNRLTIKQLQEDKGRIESRKKLLPTEIRKLEDDYSYAELELAEAKKKFDQKQKEFEAVCQELQSKRLEASKVDTEIALIETEMTDLQGKV